MPQIKAVIFDCFGVLIGKGFWQIYAECGGDLDADREFIHDELTKLNSGLIPSDEFHAAIASRLGIPEEEWRKKNAEGELPNEEVFSYIESSLKPKLKIGMLSNATFESVRKRMNDEQWGMFDDRVISAEVGMLKPDPEIFKLAAERLGVEPAECVFIDDNAPYLDGAKAVGMKTIKFTDSKSFESELERIID